MMPGKAKSESNVTTFCHIPEFVLLCRNVSYGAEVVQVTVSAAWYSLHSPAPQCLVNVSRSLITNVQGTVAHDQVRYGIQAYVMYSISDSLVLFDFLEGGGASSVPSAC